MANGNPEVGANQELSLDELRSAQQLHDEQIAHDTRIEEERVQEDADNRQKVGSDYLVRADFLKEAKTIHDELQKERDRGIEARITQAGELKKSEEAKRNEIDVSQKELDTAMARLSAIREIVGDREAAPTVKQQLDAAQLAVDNLSRDTQRLDQELSEIKSGQVSDDQVSSYQGLVERQDEIYQILDEIESNPAFIEALVNESESMGELRERLLYRVQEISGYGDSMERRKFLQEMTSIYLAEEIKAMKLDEIKDPQQKIRAMRELVEGIIIGLGCEFEDIHYRRKEKYLKASSPAGLALKNLVGVYGTMGGTLGMASAHYGEHLPKETEEKEEEEISLRSLHRESEDERFEKSTKHFLKVHQGTLNFMMNYLGGLDDESVKEIGKNSSQGWGQFERDIYQYGYMTINTDEGKVISPRDTDPEVIKKSAELFGQVKERGAQIQGERDAKEEADINAEVIKIEDRLVEIAQLIQEITLISMKLESPVFIDLNSTPRDYLSENLEKMKERKTKLESDQVRLETDLKDLRKGFGAKFKNRQLISLSDRDINKVLSDITSAELGIKKLEEFLQLKEREGQIGPKYKLEHEKSQLDSRKEQLKKYHAYKFGKK